MKAAAAKRLLGRSLDKNVRYVTFISDDDSSADDAVCSIKNDKGPYETVKVEKNECIVCG